MSTDTDHSHYIDAVVEAFYDVSQSPAEYEALENEFREAYIKFAPTTDPVTEIVSSVVLTWDENRGWQHGFEEAHRVERGHQCLTDLKHNGAFIPTVASPLTVVAAVLSLNLAIPDDVDEALAAYLPAKQPGATA